MISEVIRMMCANAIQQELFPSCVVGVVTKSGNRIIVPCGHPTYDSASTSVQADTIYDVASITKSIPTSCLALKLIDEGKLGLEDKIVKHIPEFRNSYRAQVSIRHLLTQTLDCSYRLSLFKSNPPEMILDAILMGEFNAPPGTKFFHTNSSSILLGMVIERSSGTSLDRLAQDYFFGPLGMSRTSFHPRMFNNDEIVPTEIDSWRGGVIRGKVHDETAYVLQSIMTPGSAGLFSTAPDLLSFCEMLLNQGRYRDQIYFSPTIIELMQTNQLEAIGAMASLGWDLHQRTFMGNFSSVNTFGKTGFTGCSCLCDIPRGVGIVILSNHQFPGRKNNNNAINEFRQSIADTVFVNSPSL